VRTKPLLPSRLLIASLELWHKLNSIPLSFMIGLQLAQSPVDYLAMLSRLPKPDEALARLNFLTDVRKGWFLERRLDIIQAWGAYGLSQCGLILCL
jgi:hypothetical protein